MSNEQLLTIIISPGGLTLTSSIAIVGLNLAQSRTIRSELREAARERTALRDHVDTQTGNLRDRLGRIEGRLDELREFFFRSGGAAA